MLLCDDGEIELSTPRDRENTFEPQLIKKSQTRITQLDSQTIVYMDCIVVKVRQNGSVINKAVFLALGINIEGQKELLGMWLAEK